MKNQQLQFAHNGMKHLLPPSRFLFSASLLLASISLVACSQGESRTVSRCVPKGACGDVAKAPVKQAGKYSAASGNAQKGKVLYGTLCASCHGPTGEGMPGVMMPMHLSSGVWQQTRTDNQIRQTLKRGKGQMPAFTQLSAKDIGNVIRYVRTLRKAPASPAGMGY